MRFNSADIIRSSVVLNALQQAGELFPAELVPDRTALYDPVPTVRVDVGHTVYARPVWGTEVNPACKLLLLGHAFEELGVARVGLRCDHRNTRSHQAILRLGATFEGTLRAFRKAADGTIADADYFSVTAPEWPAVRAGLEARLTGADAG